ncbi:MAG: DUF4153 domain-containing protein [bacterium]
MKLPSLKHLLHHASRTLGRFPFALLSAGLGTMAALILVDSNGSSRDGTMYNLLITAALGLPLFTTLPILAEKWKRSRSNNVLIQFSGVLLLGAYFFSLPGDVFSTPYLHLIRFFLLNIALHALVAFAPYTGKDDLNGFWQYNKSLFLRFLTAVLYSGVLYIGLVIAMAAVENLFNIDIAEKSYFQLWIFIVGMFNTWFFLAGVPENLAALNDETHYPKGLKIFTQYVLIPLVVIYLVILYAYEAKIAINWSWPKGWVANLVLGFSVSGILALLLVYPAQEQAENRWIKTFAKWYYVALIPLVVMLLLAIARRISDYGVTENRYFVLVLGLCLALIVLYFILSKKKNIKVIPVTLCLVAFLSAFGPWGAFSISERSQVKRLESLFVRNGILINGAVQKVSRPVTFPDKKEISSIVNYLFEVHGLDAIQSWFKQNLHALQEEKRDTNTVAQIFGRPAAVVGLIGLTYVNEWDTEINSHFAFIAKMEKPIPITGYDYLIPSRHLYSTQTVVEQEGYTIHFDADRAILKIYRNDDDTEANIINLGPLVESLMKEYGASYYNDQVAAEKMIVEQANQRVKTKICFREISGQISNERVSINRFQADILLGQNINLK